MVSRSFSVSLTVNVVKNVNTAALLFKSVRPVQWIKNTFVFLPLLFAKRVFNYQDFFHSLSAAVIFCLLVSGMYLINDIVDLHADRKHPEKRHRPLAAGLLSPKLAATVAAVLFLISMSLGGLLGFGFFLVLSAYILVQLLYNYRFKEIVILDVFCISASFFLRVIGGGVVIKVEISPWLVICSILISMFLALAKRRHEIVLMGESEGKHHRKVLIHYSPYLLDQMICIITAATLLSYMLYCISEQTVQKFQTHHMIYTFPFVLYGLFRYLYLIHHKNEGGAPEKVLVSDMPLLLSVILWGITSALIIYGVIT